MFFICAQLAAVSALLASLQAIALRRTTALPAELSLLVRRDLCALLAAAAAMFAAGAALPGHASAPAILAGPLIAITALIAVLQARASIRRLGGTDQRAARSPLEDVALLLHARTEPPTALQMLAPTIVVAAVAAFLRDTAERASVANAALTAGLEAIAVVACFLIFGRPLGLWGPSKSTSISTK
jgi:hypothetical protein